MTKTVLPPKQPRNSDHSIEGVYFDGLSSRPRPALLQISGQQAQLYAKPAGELPPLSQTLTLAQLHIEPPLARVRRVIKFENGGRFETPDDDAISALETGLRRNRGLSGVRRIEANWGLTLGALATLAVFTWAFITYGLPALALRAAHATPERVLESFDREAIKVLDNGSFMSPSHLSRARQAQLQREFTRLKTWAGGSYPYRLLLRNGSPSKNDDDDGGFAIGANAFALPNGTIVMTDQLVALAHNDHELMGVLAHETGHVTRRHTLQSVYQGLGLSLLSTAITGDLVSAGTFAAALPATLLTKGYSRQAETQADETAGAYMLEKYGTTKPLRDILARLETDDQKADENSIKKGRAGDDLLQTHPGTAQRIVHLREIEEAAKEGRSHHVGPQ